MEATQEEEKKSAQVVPAEDQALDAEPEKKKKKKKKKNKNTDAENVDELGQLAENLDLKDKEEEKKQSTPEDQEDNKDDAEEGEGGDPAKKKKKKKKKSGKGGGASNVAYAPREQDNSEIRLLGSWKPEGIFKQTIDYSIPVAEQFPDNVFPEGEWMEHPFEWNVKRISGPEYRQKDLLTASKVNDLRKAAECHRQVRKSCQPLMRPGIKLIDLCQHIEETNRRLVQASGLERGIAFPTGCSINDCAAHYTPNPGDDTVLGKDDVMKIDFGTQINGNIIDCAFTVAFNPTFDDLLTAVKEATNEGIKTAGIDVRLTDIGAAIQEVMESHEVTIGNTTYDVKSVENLCGHSIAPYKIHAGKSVPIVENGDNTKMDEGELFAIETFGSTGKGRVFEAPDCSHYMKDFDMGFVSLRNAKSKALLATINKNFGTLAWCRRWIDDEHPRHFAQLRELVQSGILKAYPPLNDISGSYVAQYEHTIFLHPSRKEVLSRGDDY